MSGSWVNDIFCVHHFQNLKDNFCFFCSFQSHLFTVISGRTSQLSRWWCSFISRNLNMDVQSPWQLNHLHLLQRATRCDWNLQGEKNWWSLWWDFILVKPHSSSKYWKYHDTTASDLYLWYGFIIYESVFWSPGVHETLKMNNYMIYDVVTKVKVKSVNVRSI